MLFSPLLPAGAPSPYAASCGEGSRFYGRKGAHLRALCLFICLCYNRVELNPAIDPGWKNRSGKPTRAKISLAARKSSSTRRFRLPASLSYKRHVVDLSSSRLLQALAKLNQIGVALNRHSADDLTSLADTLQLIATSASEVVPGSSAVIYTYNLSQHTFETSSRVSSESPLARSLLVDAQNQTFAAGLTDEPRPQGMGARAISRQQRVISYEEPDLIIHPAKQAAGAKGVVCYPLYVGSDALGVLYVYLHDRQDFTDLELLLLDNFVNLTAMTLAAARRITLAQQEQNRKEKELRRLRRAGMLISSRSSLQETLETILHMALEVMDAKYGIFRLVDRSENTLVTHAIAGEGLGKPAVEALPINNQSVMGIVALRREPLVISDLHEEPWKHIYYPFDRELVMRSEMAVPLIGASGRLEGVLNLESPQVDAFSRQDRYILQILATHAVTAIQEVRLLDALQEISARLLTQALPQMQQSLVEKACDLLNVPASQIWLEEGEQIVLQAALGVTPPLRRIGFFDGPIGQVLRSGQPFSAPAAALDWIAQENSQHASAGAGSVLIVPLFAVENNPHPHRPIGAFCVFSTPLQGRGFDQSEWDHKVLTILGHYAVLAFQNAAHQEALRAVQEQRAVAEAFAAVGDIASNLMHRLNNKIGTIPVRVQGIQDKSQASIAQDLYLAKNLAEIESSASAAMEIMQETLFHLRPIQFSEVCILDSVREALASVLLPPGVQVHLHGLEVLPCVQAGPKRLALVFVNLVENALEALRGEGMIEIHGSADEFWIEIRVSDSGPGISPDLHERIFEFNYSTRASDTPGKLGFGLWWSKTLMARFGGSLSVESDGVSGATFVLLLPRTEQRP